MNKYLIILIVILTSIIGVFILINRSLKHKLDIANENNITMLSAVSKYKIRDSLNVITIGRLQLNNDQLADYRKKDADLIKELKMRPALIKDVVKTTIQTKDSIVFKLYKDSCINYKSKWLDVYGCIGNKLYINSTDSIVQFFHKEYKHKFLWFKWGTKSIKQTIVNFNPNSLIKYSEWVHITD